MNIELQSDLKKIPAWEKALHDNRWVKFSVKSPDFWSFLTDFLIPIKAELIEKSIISRFYYKLEPYTNSTVEIVFDTTAYKCEKELKPLFYKRLANFLGEEYLAEFDLAFIDDSTLEDKFGFGGIVGAEVKLIAGEDIYQDPLIMLVGEEATKPLQSLSSTFSSIILSQMVDEEDPWNADNVIQKAIPLHLTILFSFLKDNRERYQFISWINHYMLRDLNPKGIDDLVAWKHFLINDFHDLYHEQEEMLLGYSEYTLESLELGDEFDEEWLNEWVEECNACSDKVATIIDTHPMPALKQDKVVEETGIYFDLDHKTYRRWLVTHDLFRSVSLQLGITMEYVPEASYYYSLKEVFKHLVNSEETEEVE